LLNDSIDGLAVRNGGIYVDATYGGGGHSAEILKRLNKGRLIAFDQDSEAFSSSGMEIGSWKKAKSNYVLLLNHNFRFIKNFLNYYEIQKVDGIIADLGISSHQIDEGARGFSTRFDNELDMRMNKNKKLSAKKMVNEYSQDELGRILRNFGELADASRIARNIADYRKHKSIETTKELMDVIKRSAPEINDFKFYSKVFQALRIEVNNEMDALKEMLLQSVELLNSGGRLVMISYHSLEDRLVKNFFRAGNLEGVIAKDFFGNPEVPFLQITKKALLPSEDEINNNSRARSAKMRIGERI
jgi:16S rRNA (cytosine1402-N4)-methyltransferase